MNAAQRVLLFIGVCVTLYLALTTTVGKTVYYVTVKHQNRLVEVPCANLAGQDYVILKSNNDVLFFDGEYFYYDVPSRPEMAAAKVIQKYDKVVGGDVNLGGYYASLFTCLLITGLLMAFAADRVEGWDDHY